MERTALKAELEAKREELSTRLARIGKDIHHREEPLSADFAEQVVEQENLDVLHAIDHEAKIELAMVEKALRRLESNQYGSCTKCGEQIGDARLNALPYADTCINCAP